MGDYRVSEFESELSQICEKKKSVEKLIRKKHRNAKDLYRLIRDNSGEYKRPFMQVYSNRCAYCGFSTDLAPIDYFEIDHYLHKNHSQFKTVADAGIINNIVLACRACNHNKLNYEIPDSIRETVFPDGEEIKSVFIRDALYNIIISDKYKDNPLINEFYYILKLGAETKRIDYAIMRLKRRQKIETDPNTYMSLGRIIEELWKKRSLLL